MKIEPAHSLGRLLEKPEQLFRLGCHEIGQNAIEFARSLDLGGIGRQRPARDELVISGANRESGGRRSHQTIPHRPRA
jgi:hypothetical protein